MSLALVLFASLLLLFYCCAEVLIFEGLVFKVDECWRLMCGLIRLADWLMLQALYNTKQPICINILTQLAL